MVASADSTAAKRRVDLSGPKLQEDHVIQSPAQPLFLHMHETCKKQISGTVIAIASEVAT